MLEGSNIQLKKTDEEGIAYHKREMICIIEKYYQNHFNLLQNKNRVFVSQVIDNAIEYGLSSEKNRYLLLNIVILEFLPLCMLNYANLQTKIKLITKQ
jgi:hypothetical protein